MIPSSKKRHDTLGNKIVCYGKHILIPNRTEGNMLFWFVFTVCILVPSSLQKR
jgi:hypothetical protein